MHIFIKVWGRLRGERLSYLSMYLHYIVFLSFSQKFSRSLRYSSIAFCHPLRNANMQCAFPTPFVFLKNLVSSLTASFQNSLKTRIKLHKIAYKMFKNCGGGEWRKNGEGRRENWGKSAMAVRGDRRPCIRSVFVLKLCV